MSKERKMASNELARMAAYGPPAAVISVLHHFRQREVPDTISMTTLTQLGVKDSLQRLVWRSLVFLGLVEESGATTETLKALRMARDDEYGTVLSEVITAAYADVIAHAPPATATRTQLLNAFRPYAPASQHERMIGLFLALCKEAGMSVAQPAKSSSLRPPSADRRTSRPPRPAAGSGNGGPPPSSTPAPAISTHDPIITGLFQKLPPSGSDFSTAALEEWMAALKAVAPVVWAMKEVTK
jgi:hypothetical protein